MDITGVEVLRDRVVNLTFADGTQKIVDLEPFLRGPIFRDIRADAGEFARVRVDLDSGTIVWPNGADLAPDVLYEGRPSARMKPDAQSA